jgi:hypothetical protein
MLTYLASPYSHPDPDVMHHRYELACAAAGVLMKCGHKVFAPIAHSHRIGQLIGSSVDHDFWLEQDFAILRHCDQMLVLLINGWKESKGVQAEIEFCKARAIPVEYLFPQDLGVAP